MRLERDRRPPDAAFCGGEHDPHCVTCGDVAEPMTVLDVDRDRELALCAAADEDRWTVEIALVAPVAIGDSLLVHAGTAIARIEPEPGALTDRDAPGSEAEEASRI